MDFSVIQMLIKAGHLVIPFLWQNALFAGVIFLMIWSATTLFKLKSPRWHYALWCLVLIRLALPPDFSHPFSGRNLLAKLHIYEQFSQFLDYVKLNNHPGWSEFDNVDGISIEDQRIYAHRNSSASTSKKFQFNLLYAGLFSAWFLCVIIFLTIYVKKLIRFHRIIKKADLVKDQSILNIAKEWCAQLSIRRSVQIVQSDDYLSPVTVGLLKPIIYLPSITVEMKNDDNLESILAHELCHIQRGDNLWIKIQSLLQIIYFFNPFVWYVNSKISLSRECICDSMVLSKNKISARNYGNGIMSVLKLNLFGAEEIDVVPGFGSQRKKLIYRIKNLKGEKIMGKYQTWLISFILFLLGIFLLPMAGNVLNNSDTQLTQLIAAEIRVASNDAISVQKEDIHFALPIKIGKVTARFGNMKDPYKQKIFHHNGIDIAAPKGTEIAAAADGRVEIATYDKGPGKHILLQHNNSYQTFYSHCDSLLVQKDQHVTSGEIIAYVGETGRATGPHLHFEIRKNEVPQDPQKFIDFKNLKRIKY